MPLTWLMYNTPFTHYNHVELGLYVRIFSPALSTTDFFLRACSAGVLYYTIITSPIGDMFQLYCCLLSADLLLYWFGPWQKFSAGMNRLHKTQQALDLAKDNTWCVRWNQFDLTIPASHGLILLLVEWAGSAGPQNEGHSVLADQTLTAFIPPLCRSLFSWSVSSCSSWMPVFIWIKSLSLIWIQNECCSL